MPFKETCVFDEKLRFMREYVSCEWTMTELCERFGISRQWGYELVRRYRAEAFAGLQPRSSAPHRHGRAMPEAIARRILELRRVRPSWGRRRWRPGCGVAEPRPTGPPPPRMGDRVRRGGCG